MERLTVNKNVSEMGICELAHNCCYAKEGKTRYRDFEMDMDARDFARNLMTTLTSDELPLEDDLFDEEILENLQYDPFADVRGLIALFYRNLWAMADLRERLKEYEDLEEQGLLPQLPCKVGDTVYMLNTLLSGKTIIGELQADIFFLSLCAMENRFGKTVFLTQAEAEEALKRMEREE